MYDVTSWELVSSGSAEIGVSLPLGATASLAGGQIYVKDDSKKIHALKFGCANVGIGISTLPVEFTASFAAFPSYGSFIRSGPGANKAGSLSISDLTGECLLMSVAGHVAAGGQSSLIFFGLPSFYGSSWGFWATLASKLTETAAMAVPPLYGVEQLETAIHMCGAVGVLSGVSVSSTPSAAASISKGVVGE